MAGPPVLRILERLARRPTAPFHEHEVLAEAEDVARGFGARISRDRWGNLVLEPPGRRPAPPIWLVAHTDHPGLEIRTRREARLLGGVAARYLRRGLRLRFYHDGEAVPARLRHYAPSTRRVILEDSAEASRLRRGDFGVFELEDYRQNRGQVRARQLDDLAGTAVALAVMQRVCSRGRLNVHSLLTRAEEVGFVGSLGAAEDGLIPSNAWIINVEASKALPGVSLGGGPVIRVGDRQMTFDAQAENLLLEAHGQLPKSRPTQRFLMSGGTCEATVWNLCGYRATGVAIPLRNYHNQGPADRLAAEIVETRDLVTAVDLIELAAQRPSSAETRDEAMRTRMRGYLRRFGPRLRATMKEDGRGAGTRRADPLPGPRESS